jgi:uncharacterized protein (DUF305 family)
MKYRTSLTALAVAAGLTVAGCSNNNQPEGPAETGPATTTAASPHNSADVEFAQQMIPHHEQALEMAKLAPTRAESQEVKDLAADIEAAQDPEIQMMTGWLKKWGEDVPSGMGGHKMDDGQMMDGDQMGEDDQMGEGMMSEDDMAALEKAKGAEFDRMFLTMMIEHHEGAITMAKDEQRDGKDTAAIELAQRIESAQTAEIKLMRKLLAE